MKTGKPLSIGLALATLLVAPRPATAQGEARADAKSSDDSEAVARQVELEMEWGGIPGLALAVLDHGVPVYERAFGLANVELGVPMTTSTLFQLSSTSKAFTGVAAALLAQDGVLDLDAPARSVLDDLPGAWGTITVRQLLDHTSGLPEVLECETADRSEALACVTAMEPPNRPGERFRYNQTNYFLVLRILEKLSGRSFPDFMRTRLFAPLGMLSTLYDGSHLDPVPGRATSYYPDGQGGLRLREFDFPEYLFSAAGLNSSLEDVVRFLGALDAGTLLAPGSRAELWREAVLADGSRSSYGLGWDLHDHGGGHRSAGHEGGRLTTLRRYLDDDLSVIVLTNGTSSRFEPDRIATRIAALFVPELGNPIDELSDRMRRHLMENDLPGALAAYREALEDPAVAANLDSEPTINALGYDLLARPWPDAAVALLRLNVERFPTSANAHDSLGEAYAATGDRESALRHYRESLRLDPENDNAEQWIDRLESGGEEPVP